MNIYFSVLQNILKTDYQKNKMILVNLVLESLADWIFSERTFYVCVSQVNLGKKQWQWHQGILHSIRTEQNIGQSTSGMSSACRNNQPCRQRKSSINYKQKIIQISP